MRIAINLLKALHGDAILLNVSQENTSTNVLIDGGPSRAFRARQLGFPGDAELKAALDEVRESGQFIDLLIMTHVDDDHIGGIISAFEHPDYLPVLAKSVIFNSGQLIHECFNLPPYPSNSIKGNFRNCSDTSINQGVTLEGFLTRRGIWIKKLFKQGSRYKLGNLDFFFLSPSDEGLKMLSGKWEKEKKTANTGKNNTDYAKSFAELLENDSFKGDRSIHNGSSISFFIEIEKRNIMFLGDAFSETVEAGLRQMGYSESNPLLLEAVKISHHGSKKNTSDSLLQIIQPKIFLITTDGSEHGLPNKLTLARIHKFHPAATIYFNYPDLIKKIFSPEEIFLLGDKIKSTSGAITIE